MARILHFGLGNFHRAHQAIYTDDANAKTGSDWTITGVSLRRPDVRDRLAAQDFDYTLVVRDSSGTEFNKVQVIDDVLVASESAAAIIAAVADPEVKVITATVTEKGYYIRASDGALDVDDPAIKADLGGEVRTFLGFLARGLRQRCDAGVGPVTILSCDNLNENGETLSAALKGFCALFDPQLLDYLNKDVRFPSCMVDRITPATTDGLIAEVADKSGWPDQSPVETERFSEWVIEDEFAAERPAWEDAGAQLVDDVVPYELRKLRLLNGAHSYLAYAGTLAGFEFVHQAIADADLLAHVRGLMGEAMETLPEGIQAGTGAYRDDLITRFSNEALHHKLRQIAMDGSQKLTMRMLGSILDRAAAGKDSPFLKAGVASWMAFALTETQAGRVLDDPKSDEITACCKAVLTQDALVHGLSGVLDVDPALFLSSDAVGEVLEPYFSAE